MSDEIETRKQAAAWAAVDLARDGMTLGLGTGSTAALALAALGERVRAGLQIVGIPSSQATEELARRFGIPLATLAEHPRLDLTIDGADEVSPTLDLIKGAGGALLREKVLASASQQFAIVVDDSKLVSRLGTRSALPVEVAPFGLPVVEAALDELGLQPTARRRDGDLVVTDNGNCIVDCQTGQIADPAALAARIRALPGVVDHGLFLGMTSVVFIGQAGGRVAVQRAGQPPAW